MTSNILIQCGFYLVVLLVAREAAGRILRARARPASVTFLTPALGWLERLSIKASGVDPRARCAGPSTRVAVLLFNLLGLLAVYALQRFQDVLPLNPAELGRRIARLVVQHRGELRHQHQLAGLRRRNDDELPHADARPGGAELRVRRDRHGGARGAHPRLRAQADRHDRQLLGRPDALARSTSCCRCRSCSRSRW